MHHDNKQGRRDFRVGLLTFSSLTLLLAGISFAGGSQLFLQETTPIIAYLPNVGGLRTGSSVCMAGMTVGKVTGISFAEAENANKIKVEFLIDKAIRSKIKVDSVPMVRTQGMMGDRYLDLSLGSVTSEMLPEGKNLLGESPSDFDATLREASKTMMEASKIMEAVNTKQGTIGQFFYDQKLYTQLTQLTEELHDLIKDFKEKPSKYIDLSFF